MVSVPGWRATRIDQEVRGGAEVTGQDQHGGTQTRRRTAKNRCGRVGILIHRAVAPRFARCGRRPFASRPCTSESLVRGTPDPSLCASVFFCGFQERATPSSSSLRASPCSPCLRVESSPRSPSPPTGPRPIAVSPRSPTVTCTASYQRSRRASSYPPHRKHCS